MVRDKDDRTSANGSPIDRRSFLRSTAAAAAAATGLASTGAASAASPVSVEVDASATVDLGDEGLSVGDAIDDYLAEHFRSGTEVRVPEGRYRWNGTGIGGDYQDAALVGDGDVVFENAADTWNENVFATGGDVLIKNVTVRGQLDSGGDKCRLRFDCRDENATLTLDNVNLPDGDASGGRTIGIYVGKQHQGTINLRNVHVEGFTNNGLYAGPYGYSDGGGGEVHVEHSFFKNNNIDGVRLGGTNDSIRNSVIVQQDIPQAWNGAQSGRGLRIRYPGDNITVQNVHITSSASSPFLVPQRKSSWEGSGSLQDVYVRNETGATAIYAERGHWTADTVHVSGGGNTNVAGLAEVTNLVQGSSATAPATSLSELDGTSDGSSGSDGSTTTYDHTLTIAGQSDQARNYTFTVDGEVVKSEANGASINPDDTIDGTTVDGVVYWGEDSYQFNGSITSFDMEDGPTVSLDGQQVDPATLGDQPDLTHTVMISGSNDQAESYSLTVSGDIQKSDEGTASINPDDTISGSTAEGVVYWGEDAYNFSGELTDLSVDGNPTVTVDGQEVDPANIGTPDLTNRVVIDARNFGGTNAYSFEVSGAVEPSTDFPTESDDTIDGSVVQGTVGGEVDAYRYSGDLTAFSLDGSAKVIIEDNDD